MPKDLVETPASVAVKGGFGVAKNRLLFLWFWGGMSVQDPKGEEV